MRRFGISSDKISMDEVQNLQSAPMGMVSHPWRELLHGVIPGGTKVVATRVVRPQTADPKRVARDFDAECKKLKLVSDYAIFIKYSACHSIPFPSYQNWKHLPSLVVLISTKIIFEGNDYTIMFKFFGMSSS